MTSPARHDAVTPQPRYPYPSVNALVAVLGLVTLGMVSALVFVEEPTGPFDPLASLVGIAAPGDDPTIGSGVVIGPRLVLTNQHVIDALTKPTPGTEVKPADVVVMIRSVDGTTVKGKVLWSGVADDLALIETETDLLEPSAVLNCAVAPVGTRVAAAGFPLGLGAHATYGRVAALVGTRAWQNLDLTILPGNSGGPVYDLATGRVVGLAAVVWNAPVRSPFGTLGSQSGLSGMVPGPRLCAALGRDK